MLKKTFQYNNLDGTPVTEDYYFNMTKAELLKLQIREGEGFKDYLTQIIESGDGAAIIETFEKIIRLAFGQKIDGKFVKSTEAFDVFMATEAYSELFYELVTDAVQSARFINGIMPAELMAQANAEMNQKPGPVLISENLAEHLEVAPSLNPNMDRAAAGYPEKPKKQPRSKQELLAAFREKNASHERNWAGMTEAEAMDLSQNDFYKWLNAQQ